MTSCGNSVATVNLSCSVITRITLIIYLISMESEVTYCIKYSARHNSPIARRRLAFSGLKFLIPTKVGLLA